MDTLSTFIAIELNKEIRDELSRIQDALKKSEADVKWINVENLHITLKFLGQIEQQKIIKISQVMESALKSYKPFALSLKATGAFPKIAYPRVIWVSTSSPQEQLIKLAQNLETGLVSLKFAKERREFKSHITLGRVRSGKNKAKLTELLEQTAANPKEMLVQTVTLFKSTLSCAGPHYGRLFTFNL